MVRMKHRDYEFDDEIFDDEVFDRRYFPRRVYRDGYGPHVSLMLTDAMPRAHLLHKPGSATLTDAQVDVRERALAARSARLRDAWRGSAMAPDDDDVFALATRIAPLLGLAPPKANATRSSMDGQPPADPDPRAAAEAALADRARRKSQAWKTSWSARR
jgi:hypothetical protein